MHTGIVYNEGLGALISPTAILEAKIKKRLATFLTAESELITLKMSLDGKTRSRANSLYIEHMALDKDREKALKYIDDIKANGFGLIKISFIGSFVNNMENHLDEVKELKKYATGKGAYPEVGGGGMSLFTKIGYGLGALLLYKLLK